MNGWMDGQNMITQYLYMLRTICRSIIGPLTVTSIGYSRSLQQRLHRGRLNHDRKQHRMLGDSEIKPLQFNIWFAGCIDQDRVKERENVHSMCGT